MLRRREERCDWRAVEGLLPELSLEVATVALPQGTHLSPSTWLIYKNQSSSPGRSGTQLLFPHDMPFSGVWNSTWLTTKGTTWEAEFSFARARGRGSSSGRPASSGVARGPRVVVEFGPGLVPICERISPKCGGASKSDLVSENDQVAMAAI